MAIPKIQGAQRDFSAGELDTSMKRGDDNPIMKAGARQLSNWRILNSKSVRNRPGRIALFLATGRVDEVTMSPGNTFFIAFGQQTLKVFNSAGSQVFTSTKLGDGATTIPWTTATAKNVVWDTDKLSIYIAFAGIVPQILTWDGVSTWTLATFAETVSAGDQKRTFFYRISPKNITMVPSATSGAGITVTFSANVLTNSHIGTRMRYVGRQLTITAVASGTSGTATVNELLPFTVNLHFASVGSPDVRTIYNVGDEVIGSSSGARGVVTSHPDATHLHVVMLKSYAPAASGVVGRIGASSNTEVVGGFVAADFVVGPNGGTGQNLGDNAVLVAPEATTIWDDEVMNSFRGYPSSVFVDQNRVGFCNFPAVPAGVGWSAIGQPTDLYVDALPSNAIFELAPGKSQVLYVVAGPESSEFVFCDNGIYYIPITSTNPLKPGSVAFNLLSKDGCAPVQPRALQEAVLWVNAGYTGLYAIVAPGAYYRPYGVTNLTELHGHLIKTPIAIAAPSTTSQFEERYAYVLNSDGTVAVGKYNIENGQIKGMVGWLPWNGAGTPGWLSAFGSNVTFSTSYQMNGVVSAVNIIERLDATQYLDCAMMVNAAPTAFTPPPGLGPLWWIAGQTVELMDQTTRMMGTYVVDVTGFIVPQNNGGENLAAATLVAGQTWTATLEPFVPDAQPGPAVHQRMFKRRVSRMAVYAINSSGFLLARLFSGPLTRTSPALGTIMNQRRISTWNQDDDPTLAPPLREEAQRWRPLGRAYDPRVAIIKDTPGPLEIPEIGIEASI